MGNLDDTTVTVERGADQPLPLVGAVRQLLAAHFSDEELNTLCHDLAIDHEVLPAQDKTSRARELVAYVERRGQLGALLHRCRALRPHVAWPSVDPQPKGAAPVHPPDSAPYHLTPALIAMLATICTTPGYHLVLGEAGFGKTALMRYLAGRWRPSTVIYSFNRVEGRVAVEPALNAIREQLRLQGNLPTAANYPLAELIRKSMGHIQPWSLAYRRNWPQLLILIDGLDECDPSERAQFRDLLPANLPAFVGVVLTLRPTVRAAIEGHFLPDHPLRKAAVVHDLPPLDVADIRRMLLETYHIYADPALCRKIKRLSAGHPAAVIALCHSLEIAMRQDHDPDAVLRTYKSLHTFQRLFDHELDQMEHRCTSHNEYLLLRKILGTLAAARRPLAADHLAAILSEPLDRIQVLIERLDRFLCAMGSRGIAFNHPQFVEYLWGRDDWRPDLDAAQTWWDAWRVVQEPIDPLAAAFVARLYGELLPALQGIEQPWITGWADGLNVAIRSHEEWIAMISAAWEAAESRRAPLADQPQPDPAELLLHALLITSWSHGQSTLPPPGSPSPDAPKHLVLTDQLRQDLQPQGAVELREVSALLEMFTSEAAFETVVSLVSELAYAWCREPDQPQQQFAQILRLITQAARGQATISPLTSPRANLLDLLSDLAPAIRYHFPAYVEPICRLVDTVIDLFP